MVTSSIIGPSWKFNTFCGDTVTLNASATYANKGDNLYNAVQTNTGVEWCFAAAANKCEPDTETRAPFARTIHHVYK